MKIETKEVPYTEEYVHNSDPVECLNGDWGFWDESWSVWYGGHKDEAEARAKLEEYCRIYL